MLIIGGASTLTFNQPNTFTGGLTVNAATMDVSGFGSLASTDTVGVGGNLTLDNSSINIVQCRLGSSSVTLDGGTLAFLGASSGSSTGSVSIAGVTVAAGSSVISSTQGAGNASFAIGTLARNVGATVQFQGIGQKLGTTAGNQIIVGSLGTGATTTTVNNAGTNNLGANILAYATELDAGQTTVSFATFNAGGITAFMAFAPTSNINSVSSNGLDVFEATSGGTLCILAGNETIAGLVFVGGSAPITGPGSDTLSIGSATPIAATIVVNGTGNSIGGPTLKLGLTATTTEGIVNTNSISSIAINSPIVNSTVGVDLAGSGSITLGGSSTGLSTYSGTTWLEGANVLLTSNNVIPIASTITLISGALQSSAAVTLPNTTTVGVANGISSITLGSSGNMNALILGNGTMTLTGLNAILNVPGSTGSIYITGVIAGATATTLTKTGAGTLSLYNANTYVGTTMINQGIVNLQDATGLGPAASSQVVVANGATLQLEDVAVGAKPLLLSGNGAGNGALENYLSGGVASPNTWAGPIGMLGATTIGLDAGLLALGGVISGSADLTKIGGGTLTLGGASTYTGETNINAGIGSVTAAAALGSIAGGTSDRGQRQLPCN